MQKALVIGGLREKAGEFEIAQQRIRDEANRKRAEAAREQENRGNRYTVAKSVEVPPQVEGRPLKNEPEPAQPIRDRKAEQTTRARARDRKFTPPSDFRFEPLTLVLQQGLTGESGVAGEFHVAICLPFVEGKSAVFAAFRLRICPPKKSPKPPMPDLFLGQGRSSREGLTTGSGRADD